MQKTQRLRKVARLWSGVIVTVGLLIFAVEFIDAGSAGVGDYPWYENLIPVSLVLSLLGLLVAWRNECVGGLMAVGFALLSLVLYVAVGRTAVGLVSLILAPVVVPGFLFIACWRRTRQAGFSDGE
jgi:hypothetical protein